MSAVRIIDTHTWDWRDEGCTEYQGTKEDLLAVGVAWPEVFDDVGKSGTKTRGKWAGVSSLEERYTVRRMAHGQWRVAQNILSQRGGSFC